jgi:hypothetical protein
MTTTLHTVTPIGREPLQVATADGDCEFCEAVRAHFDHERGNVVFFEIPEAPKMVQRVAIVWLWPLLLDCRDVTREDMQRELTP